MYMGALPACVMCTMFVPGACGGLKRASDPVELGLLMVVSHHVRAGNKTQVLYKSNKCS